EVIVVPQDRVKTRVVALAQIHTHGLPADNGVDQGEVAFGGLAATGRFGRSHIEGVGAALQLLVRVVGKGGMGDVERAVAHVDARAIVGEGVDAVGGKQRIDDIHAAVARMDAAAFAAG